MTFRGKNFISISRFAAANALFKIGLSKLGPESEQRAETIHGELPCAQDPKGLSLQELENTIEEHVESIKRRKDVDITYTNGYDPDQIRVDQESDLLRGLEKVLRDRR